MYGWFGGDKKRTPKPSTLVRRRRRLSVPSSSSSSSGDDDHPRVRHAYATLPPAAVPSSSRAHDTQIVTANRGATYMDVGTLYSSDSDDHSDCSGRSSDAEGRPRWRTRRHRRRHSGCAPSNPVDALRSYVDLLRGDVQATSTCLSALGDSLNIGRERADRTEKLLSSVTTSVVGIKGAIAQMEDARRGDALTTVRRNERAPLSRDPTTGELGAMFMQADRPLVVDGSRTPPNPMRRLYDNINDGGETLRAALAHSLVQFEYATRGDLRGETRRLLVHAGAVFGSLDVVQCQAVLASFAPLVADGRYEPHVVDSFWRCAHGDDVAELVPGALDYSGPQYAWQVLSLIESMSRLMRAHVRTHTLPVEYCLKWINLEDRVVNHTLHWLRAQNARLDVFERFMLAPICTHVLGPALNDLLPREVIARFEDSPHWRIVVGFCRLHGHPLNPARYAWQLSMATRIVLSERPPESRGWINAEVNSRTQDVEAFEDGCTMRGTLTRYMQYELLGYEGRTRGNDGPTLAEGNRLLKSQTFPGGRIDGVCELYTLPRANMTLCVTSEDTDAGSAFQVHDWVVMSVWPYIATVIAAGLVEAADRRIELPSDFPPDLLLHLVSAIYGVKSVHPMEQSWDAFMQENEGLYRFEALVAALEGDK